MNEVWARIKSFAKRTRIKINVLILAISDRRTPLVAKLLALITVAYFLSPIDLIPDFIPVLGLLDDLILVPALIYLTLKIIPKNLLAELEAKSADSISYKKRWYFALPVILVYAAALFWLYKIILRNQ